MNNSLQTKTIANKTIKGHEYAGRYIPASEACDIAYELATIMTGNNGIQKLAFSGENNLILKILFYTTRDGVAINEATFDTIYTGNLGELFEAVKYSVEANFSDFLEGGGFGLLATKEIKAQQKVMAN
jgi:hypothetical protein